MAQERLSMLCESVASVIYLSDLAECGLVVVLDAKLLAGLDDNGRDLAVVVLGHAGEDVVRGLVVECTYKGRH